jgi:hypothetical protein
MALARNRRQAPGLVLVYARAACKLGDIDACAYVVEQTRDPAVTAQVSAACDDGDVDACAVLPGRAIAPAELCAAGDQSVCSE